MSKLSARIAVGVILGAILSVGFTGQAIATQDVEIFYECEGSGGLDALFDYIEDDECPSPNVAGLAQEPHNSPATADNQVIGRVWHDKDRDGEESGTPGEPGAAGTQVLLGRHDGAYLVGTTDADGWFSFWTEEGTYKVCIDNPATGDPTCTADFSASYGYDATTVVKLGL